ncbi:MAG: CHAT domain-containing protein [Richelia sp. CSU_2_1]|nr:CHAT domain-containing protein [Richelia sp. CSU_2_1]
MTNFRCFLMLTSALVLLPLAARSQPVIPANDGTNTVVDFEQNRFNITGGQLSGDGSNLFHSLSQFNLNEGQIANFLTNPNIQNILTRISGGDVSVINGLISVSGGNSNLFLMNPAGIVFGQNARLNVPGSFFATTATGIGFGDRTFNAAGINDYQTLVGNPNSFNFNNSQIGAIVNAGKLEVGSGQSLTLLGGTVINSGQLSAPSGQITVAAVPGQNTIRISQTGNLLSLEISPIIGGENSSIAPVDLPQLLTGPGVAAATGLTANAQGQVILTNGQTVTANPGSAIAGGAIDASAIARGNGGTVVISGENTSVFGSIAARGGTAGGDGGSVEIAGKNSLTFQAEVDTRAVNGAIGSLLLATPNTAIGTAELEAAQDRPLTFISESQLEQMAAGSNIVVDTASDITIQNLPDNLLSLQARTGDSVTFRSGGVFFVNDPNDLIQTQGGSININASSISLGRVNAGGGNIALTANGIDLRGGSNSITSTGGTISLQPPDSRQIRIGGGGDNLGILDLTAADISALAPSFRSIAIGRTDSSNPIAIVAPTTFNSPLTLRGSSIAVENPLRATDSAAIAFNAPETAIGANIATSGGDLTFTGSVSLTADAVLSTQARGNILFQQALEGSRALRLDAQRVLFGATVGQSSPLASLTVNGRSTEISGAISTTGNITFNSSVTLDRSSIITSRADSITFANSLDSLVGTANNLTLQAGGSITFGGPVGQTHRLGQLATDSASVTAAATVAADRLTAKARDNAIFRGNTSVSSGARIEAGNLLLEGNLTSTGGDLELQGTREVQAGSITSRGGSVRVQGDAVAAGAIDTSQLAGTAGAIAIVSGVGGVNAGNLNASGAIGGNIILNSSAGISAGDLNSSATVGNGGNVFSSAIGNVQLGFINAQGGSRGAGGNVSISTTDLVRSNGVFTDISGNISSISTVGSAGAGAISIRHSGGSDRPFVIGGAIENGTRGTINAGGGNAIFPAIAFPETYTQGSFPNQISLITPSAPQPPAPPPTPAPTPAPIPAPTPVPVTPLIDPARALSIATDLQVDVPPNGGRNSQIKNDLQPPARRFDSSSAAVLAFEQTFTREYEKYLELPPRRAITNMSVIYEALRRNEALTGVKTGIIYMNWVSRSDAAAGQTNSKVLVANGGNNLILPTPIAYGKKGEQPEEKNSSRLAGEAVLQQSKEVADIPKGEGLELIVVTANAEPVRVLVPAATRWQVLQLADALQSEITNPRRRSSISYLDAAQKLYRWLIAPIAAELTASKTDNLIVIPAAGLRSVPFAALHDGQQFLIEKYSTSVIPSLSLTDIRYDNISDDEVLAMGISVFEDKPPLPAVPVELQTIAPPDRGKSFLNQEFTLANLQAQRSRRPFGVIHLATHSEFQPGEPSNSYIQLWDTKLQIDEMQQLRWNEPPVNLLVLSACSTALGDEQAELGFAGLAVAAGAKSALASLWEVSDEGTLGLMAEFYRQLRIPQREGKVTIKAEALRQAQLQMLRGRVRIQDGMLRVEGRNDVVTLPDELAVRGDRILSHPYYWAAFTTIGNPW